MSRSYKLIYVKDGSKSRRQKHHRAYRRHVKQAVTTFIKNYPGDNWYKEGALEWWIDGEPKIKHSYQITNQYDICDYYWGFWTYWDEYYWEEKKAAGSYWFKGKPNRIAK